MKTDILIVGCGCSGLYCALNLSKNKNITIISKSDLVSSDSYLAQGGICMLKDDEDYNKYFEDTMKAGHYENDKNSVSIMINSSQQVISDLVHFGVEFAREEDGLLAFTKEGAHSDNRILYHEDTTGKAITEKLLAEAQSRDNITIIPYTSMLDIISSDNCCYGAVVQKEDGTIDEIRADYTVWATGGIGGLYKHSTNFKHLTGDALAIAIRHGIQLKDIDYVQIHPTTLYVKGEGERSFLISESVRGEGAKLYDKNGNRFVDELQPRDVVSKAILNQMEKDGTDFVWEDLRTIPEDELRSHFPAIIEHCREAGYDVFKECIPVVPAQHYFMGGVKVNHHSRTSMECLYAVGESACNGVHGRNRLASNSLLESLVFAKRAAGQMAEIGFVNDEIAAKKAADSIDLADYSDEKAVEREYRKLAMEAIEGRTSAQDMNAESGVTYIQA